MLNELKQEAQSPYDGFSISILVLITSNCVGLLVFFVRFVQTDIYRYI